MSALRRSISIPRNTPLAIVYTDVGGSTVASESLGERKAHRQIQRHNAIVRRACAAARGFELKLLGDGFQLAFPSVESALRFATEVQREFASRRARDGGLAVRIGVHVGVPILSRGEVGGRVAIIAQRVMSVARPGEVFVTADSVAGAGAMPGIRLVDRGAYRLKGIRESVLLCEVLWRGDDVAPACDQAGPGSQPSSAGPFVGRVFALFQLEDALTRAMNGRPVLVAVQGDAGIGKTQLVHEFSRRVGRRRVVFGGGCAYPGERRPFGVIVEALRSLAVSGLPVGWPASVRSLVAGSAKRAMRATGAAARVASRDPEDSRRHMLDAIVAALLEPRSEMATIVFLDDIHESDDDTLEVVRALGRRIAHGGVEARTLVILGFQPAEVARRPTLAELLRDLDRLEALDRVTLSGMTREEARTLLKAISAEAHHHTHFEALFDRSAGNPLFLRELARDLAERIQEQRSRRFESTPPGVDPPLRVQDVIGRRLARLRPPSLEVLRCAALLSPSFNATIVGAALQLDSESMLRALEDALEAGLLREALIDGSVVYTFEHRLVAEVLAAQLGLARRAQYHLALADALERINGTASPESVAQVAHHLIRAGREVPPARVVLHAEAAGDAARKVSALQSAVGFYSAAVEAIGRDAGQDGTREAALRTKLFEGLGHLGRVDEARFHADHVIAFFEGQGEKEAEARARMAIASLLASHAGYADAVAYLERAVEASRCGDPVLHGTVLARLCVALDQTGRPTDMRRMSRRLDAFAARTGRRDLAERALNVKRNWIQNYTNRFASLPDLTGRLAKSAAKRHDDWF